MTVPDRGAEGKGQIRTLRFSAPRCRIRCAPYRSLTPRPGRRLRRYDGVLSRFVRGLWASASLRSDLPSSILALRAPSPVRRNWQISRGPTSSSRWLVPTGSRPGRVVDWFLPSGGVVRCATSWRRLGWSTRWPISWTWSWRSSVTTSTWTAAVTDPARPVSVPDAEPHHGGPPSSRHAWCRPAGAGCAAGALAERGDDRLEQPRRGRRGGRRAGGRVGEPGGVRFRLGDRGVAALVVTWRRAQERRGECTQSSDRAATRAIAASFAVLAGYVAVEAVRDLTGGIEPDVSIVGVILAGLSLMVMPWLARAKCRLGPTLGSTAVVADAKQTNPWTPMYLPVGGESGLGAVFTAWLLCERVVVWGAEDAHVSCGVRRVSLADGDDRGMARSREGAAVRPPLRRFGLACVGLGSGGVLITPMPG